MQELLTLIVAWLAINFGLPATDRHPQLDFVTPAEMVQIRLDRGDSLSGERVAAQPGRSAPPDSSHGVYAIYDDRSRTIYLPERWSVTSPAHVSMLVHELVHHVQNVGGVEYACPEARERPAYRAQARWLELFGTTLSREFAIDPMTLHLRTHCMR